MRIIITGISGFVGKNILKILVKSNIKILGISRKKRNFSGVKMIKGDLNNFNKLKKRIVKFNPNALIHCAWQSMPDYSFKVSQKNYISSKLFFDFIVKETGCKKIIVAGSCLEYGVDKGECNENKKTIISKSFNYCKNFIKFKNSLYKYYIKRCDELSINLVWFRIFFAYGQGQRKKALIPYILKLIKKKKQIVLKNPLHRCDYIYIKDVAKAFKYSLEKNIDSGIYNLGTGKSVYNYKIANYLLKQKNCKISIKSKKSTKNLINKKINFWANTKKTKKYLDFKTKYSIEKGIKDLLNFNKT